MQRKKRLSIILIALLISAFLLSACSTDGDSTVTMLQVSEDGSIKLNLGSDDSESSKSSKTTESAAEESETGENTEGDTADGDSQSGDASSESTGSTGSSSNSSDSSSNSSSESSSSSDSSGSTSTGTVTHSHTSVSGGDPVTGTKANQRDYGSSYSNVHVDRYTMVPSENAISTAKTILSSITTSSMSEFEKVKAMHDWMVMNIDYDYARLYNNQLPTESHSADGALNNRLAVCDGYANLFQLFCDLSGIDCYVVTGVASGENHAWNQVYVGGYWYNIDVTWDDPITTSNGQQQSATDYSALGYSYFLLSDSDMNQDHTRDGSFTEHTCTAASRQMDAIRAGVPWRTSYVADSYEELVSIYQTMASSNISDADIYMTMSYANLYHAALAAGVTVNSVSYYAETIAGYTRYVVTLATSNGSVSVTSYYATVTSASELTTLFTNMKASGVNYEVNIYCVPQGSETMDSVQGWVQTACQNAAVGCNSYGIHSSGDTGYLTITLVF